MRADSLPGAKRMLLASIEVPTWSTTKVSSSAGTSTTHIRVRRDTRYVRQSKRPRLTASTTLPPTKYPDSTKKTSTAPYPTWVAG